MLRSSIAMARGLFFLPLLLSLGCESGPRRGLDEKTAKTSEDQSRIERALSSVSATILIEDGEGTKQRVLSELLAGLGPKIIETEDPYYKRHKRFVAVPLAAVLEHFWPGWGVDSDERVKLEARDGYQVLLTPQLAFDDAAYLAFYDIDQPPFAAIGEQSVSPDPLYLIWKGSKLTNLESHPRPWAISKIARLPSSSQLTRLVPDGGFASNELARSGHAIFTVECVRCHSMNQQGGKVGPDLNIPQNILEYRPKSQVRAYIKDPKTFRYSTMPAHPNLTERNLDELVAYLEAMSTSKHDPNNEKTVSPKETK